MVAQWCKIQSLFLHLLSLKLFIFSVSFIYAQSDLIYSVSSYIIQTHLILGAELAAWREGRCSLLFLENRIKVAEFCKKMCNYGLNSHLKCSFKSILEKKHQDVSPKYFNAGSFFSMTDKNFDQSASIPRNLSCSPKSSDCALVIFIRSHFIFTLIHFFHSVFFFVFSLTYHAGGYRAASTVMQQI